MPRYHYQAVDLKGRPVTGELDSQDDIRAADRLRDMGYFPTQITAAGKTTQPPVRRPVGRVKPRELVAFTRQLATVIDAGLPLLRGLDVMRKQHLGPNLNRIIDDIAESIETGGTFSESLAHHPRVFSPLYVNMVRAGEAGGVLDVTLTRLAEFQEKSQRIKSKVVTAMVYPAIVILVAAVIVAFLMVVIVPRFQEIFGDLMDGRPLPTLTLVVIAVSNALRHHGLLVFGLLATLGMTLKWMARNPSGRYWLDQWTLRMPLAGKLASKAGIARFSRTLSTLIASGVPILQALTIVRETVGNAVIARAVQHVHTAVKEGESMAQPLLAAGVFPALVVNMVEVGEHTGALPEMLAKVADVYDDEVDNTVAALTSMLEPVMIVFLAVVVGTIVIAMFLPIITIVIGMH